MSYRIVMDSCAELPEEYRNDPRFVSVPLTLTVGGEDIVDDETFDQAEFIKKVAAARDCPKSSCPSPDLYCEANNADVDYVFVVTL